MNPSLQHRTVLVIGRGGAEMFSDQSERNPAGRIGTAEDIADAVLFAMTSTFLTGITLAVDGGEALT
jgi:NAD(P)-dependent dehydrogenase (short-subunit alcohol dehydrogenase family)